LSGLRQRQWIADLCATEDLPPSYAKTVSRYLEPLAAIACELRKSKSRPVVIGISGAQGSGKSTLALFLANHLRRETQLSSTCLSLDDFYLGKAARLDLADKVHPLFATRGVPGTHDVQLALNVLRGLTDVQEPATIRLPKFDKATDDCLPENAWPEVDTPVDVVILEGWCLGARPQDVKSLAHPVNALEDEDDPDGAWRRRVNDHLSGDYREWFDQLDTLIMLRIPSFDKILEWRGVQEEKLVQKSAAAGYEELHLDRFIVHFERLTRHMLQTMPSYADTIIDIDEQHRMSNMTHYLRRQSNSSDAKF
jgi:D-glycerate 3-kinase